MADYLHIQAHASGHVAADDGETARQTRPPMRPASPSRAFVAGTAAVAALWLAVITALAASGAFRAAPGDPPVATLLAVAGPPLVFLALLRLLPGLRRQILAVDPVWLTAVQGLRALGASFLFLHAFGHLPALFAHPAGWGDVLVGVLAPFAAARLARDAGVITSAWLWRFHALGMLDFVVAVSAGVLSRGTVAALVDGVTSSVLGELPLALVPGFGVPLFNCLHIAMFTQIAAARRSGA